MKYDPLWLQSEAERLGSWNKVMQEHNISPKTIDKYKKLDLIFNLPKEDVDICEIQKLYDSGMSIAKICKSLGIPHSRFSSQIKTRTRSDAKLCSDYVMDDNTRRKLSVSAKIRGLGGYRPHPNRGAKYKNIWFDSKWEITVAKSLDENQILWERPNYGFVWTDCGRKYYPDFFLPDYNIFLDPKNPYLMEKDSTKISQAMIRNNITVIMLNENQLSWAEIKKLLC